ncbi:phosphotransferase [Streptomyces cinnamoneus]|uniref:Phosphotransferase n=1 Tax=Streptomyces cinnamoneus TaxID=53446 RepID=A0A918TAC3_STRCJ|nr:phosphotransferase [Streptomyces cinnamoneus]GHC38916.1 phosphotransferase [Streptomyces cinnamoneus]
MTAPQRRDEERDEEVLAGGGVNHVVRIGSTVRRPVGPWTRTVHALLDHLQSAGFAGAPRAHGFDTEGRGILDFLPGSVAGYPLPDYVRSDATLQAVAVMLRRYHDATVSFTPAEDASWYFPGREPAEVICHGDVAPYNCVFRDERPVAFIDFDTAHPGPRIWDLAYAAYRFVPLTDPGNGDFTLPVEEQARRLRLLADAYQLDHKDRAALADTARDRLEHLVRHMHEQADAGNAAFAEHIAAGHDALYRTDAAHIARHSSAFTEALMRNLPQRRSC